MTQNQDGVPSSGVTSLTSGTGSSGVVTEFPQKRYYRQRAHSNPLSDHSFDYPVTPDDMDWSSVFPSYTGDVGRGVDFLDIGCGYGGLIVNLSPLFPDKLMLGFEIRVKVSDYVQDRIRALQDSSGGYGNIACMRTNAMKYLPNYFHKAQLSKMFFMFPDPHFKKSKHKWRIINSQLLAEYAYVLKEGGLVYTITDVEDLHVWMVHHLTKHPLFRRVPDDDLSDDVIIPHLYNSSEEGQKVSRNSGQKWLAVFKRVSGE